MSSFLLESIVSKFDQQENCDIEFVVDGKVIGAHQFVFGAVNERYKGLYEIAIGCSPGDEPITIEDMNYDHFKALLRYVYTEEISISNDNVFIFLAAAIKFKMGQLEGTCADYINNYISKENVCIFMNEAINFQSQALQEMCQERFSKETHEITESDLFLAVSQPALSAFLDAECINELEVHLFQDVKKWMKQKCQDRDLDINGDNMRQVIGDALYKLRFPTMTAQDFANCVTTIKGLLTDTEKTQIFETIMVFDNDGVECLFPKKVRCKFNGYYMPFKDMANLRSQKIVYNNYSMEDSELLTMLEYIKNLPDQEVIDLTSFRFVLQCCADLANCSGTTLYADAENQNTRNELYDEFSAWLQTAATDNIQDITTKYLEIRTKLNKLCVW